MSLMLRYLSLKLGTFSATHCINRTKRTPTHATPPRAKQDPCTCRDIQMTWANVRLAYAVLELAIYLLQLTLRQLFL